MKIIVPKQKAAGIGGIYQALRHVSMEMGIGPGLRLLSQMNQKGGFDCPGCAWPDPDEKRSTLGEYCENGAKAIAEEATLKRVNLPFFKKHSVKELSTWSDYQLGKAGRLTDPVILRPNSDHYEPISWDDAFQLLGEEMRGLASPDEAAFLYFWANQQ